MESLSGLKLNIQIILNLLEKVKIIYGLSLKKKRPELQYPKHIPMDNLHPSNWITHFQTQGNILIVGDLYAHTAEEAHTTSTNRDKYMNNKTHTSLTLPLRNNYDKINK